MIRLALILCALAGCGAQPHAQPATVAATQAVSATVGRVIDGDTIELADGTRVRLRYLDTPESRSSAHGQATPEGKRASAFLAGRAASRRCCAPGRRRRGSVRPSPGGRLRRRGVRAGSRDPRRMERLLAQVRRRAGTAARPPCWQRRRRRSARARGHGRRCRTGCAAAPVSAQHRDEQHRKTRQALARTLARRRQQPNLAELRHQGRGRALADCACGARGGKAASDRHRHDRPRVGRALARCVGQARENCALRPDLAGSGDPRHRRRSHRAPAARRVA